MQKTSGTCKHVSLCQHPVLIRLVFLSPSSSLWQCMDRDNQNIPRGHLCSRESGYIVIVSFSEDLSPCCFCRGVPNDSNGQRRGVRKINMASFVSRENSSLILVRVPGGFATFKYRFKKKNACVWI